jgi:hypothetical protein
MDTEIVTPYSTVTPYISAFPEWVPELEQQRIAAYDKYDDMYWSVPETFDLVLVDEENEAGMIFIPNPRKIVDITAHYFLKGLTIQVEEADRNKEQQLFLDDFFAREEFFSRFQVAKLSGVVKGDWVFHITGDPEQPEGSRISINSVHPGSYFPEYDPDDLNNRIGVRLVELQVHPDDPNKSVVKILQYGYNDDRSVWRIENLWELEGWNDPAKAKLLATIHPLETLDKNITQIPVYHFKNGMWDGDPYGSSELKGLERVFEAINQAITDTDTGISLSGLGAYVTDASPPVDKSGNEIPWVISPGKVLTVPGQTMFKKLDGINSITAIKDHITYLEQSLYEATGTPEVSIGRIDVATAESPMTLAVKFEPLMSKISLRDTFATEKLTQMFFDLKVWFRVYESVDFGDLKIEVKLGDKLPINRTKHVEELNNMMDRKVISRKFFRLEMTKLGYVFPDDIEQEILDEEKAFMEVTLGVQQEQFAGPGGRLEGANDTLPDRQQSRSNNVSRVNESDGNEITTR